jgi:multidrug efflux pump subunit AcrA (membrane-fusion protein)
MAHEHFPNHNDFTTAMHDLALELPGTTFAGAYLPNVPAPTPAAPSRRDPSLVEQFNDVCAVVELAAAMADADDFDDAAMALVNSLGWHLGGAHVALTFRQGARKTFRLRALSGVAEVVGSSPLAQLLVRATDELLAAADGKEDPVALTGTVENSAEGTEGLSAVCRNAGVAEATGVALRRRDGKLVGALFTWDYPPNYRLRVERMLSAGAEPIGSVLALAERSAQFSLLIGAKLFRALGKRWVILAAVLLAMATTALTPYRVATNCTVEALERRFVVAPFEGVFEKSLVKPGDLVEQGQVLARMDGRELRIELGTVKAECERVRKSHDVNLAAGKVAAAQIDRLELDRLNQRQELLEHRAVNLEIRSPRAGIVLSGDLERTEGAPLTVGQVLYEIAAVDSTVVEAEVDDADVSLVEAGQHVVVRFDGLGGAWSGVVKKVHPRSEIRDSHNVFVAEIALDEPELALRPGMKGRAKFTTTDSSLLGLTTAKAWRGALWLVGW